MKLWPPALGGQSLNHYKQVTQAAGQVSMPMLTITLERVLCCWFFSPISLGKHHWCPHQDSHAGWFFSSAALLRCLGSPGSLLATVVLLSMVLDSAWLLTQEQQGEYVNVPDLFLLPPIPLTPASGMHSYHFSSVAQSHPTLCDPVDCSTPGLPVHHQLLEFTQTHVH